MTDIIKLAREAGFSASVGKTDKEGNYHPNVNALSKDVPIEWLERFAELVAAPLKADAERLNWLQRNLFGHKWNGVMGSGSRTSWEIWSGYRHVTANMIGDTFRAAIDAARAKEQT